MNILTKPTIMSEANYRERSEHYHARSASITNAVSTIMSEANYRERSKLSRALRALVLVLLFSLCTIPKIQAQFEGTIGLGLHAGYGAEINSLGGGVHGHYYHTNNIRLAPSFTWFLERKGESMWMTDADAHYIFPVSLSASLYPIAGLHYSQWKYDAVKSNSLPAEDWTKHRLGANLGLGFQHDIAYRVRANFELKYQFIPNYSQVVFMAGIGFWL